MNFSVPYAGCFERLNNQKTDQQAKNRFRIIVGPSV